MLQRMIANKIMDAYHSHQDRFHCLQRYKAKK